MEEEKMLNKLIEIVNEEEKEFESVLILNKLKELVNDIITVYTDTDFNDYDVDLKDEYIRLSLLYYNDVKILNHLLSLITKLKNVKNKEFEDSLKELKDAINKRNGE